MTCHIQPPARTTGAMLIAELAMRLHYTQDAAQRLDLCRRLEIHTACLVAAIRAAHPTDPTPDAA
jgi:hypothetical protein